MLIEEFRAIPRDLKKNVGNRDLDGLIVLGEPKSIQRAGSFDFTGRDIVIVQTKPNRLGMGIMGQALFSMDIMKRFNPRSVKTVAICGRTDKELVSICDRYGIEVVVISDEREAEGRAISSEEEIKMQNKALHPTAGKAPV